MSLAENLLAARTAAGLSQQQVADALRSHQPKVSEIEHGQRAVSALELKVLAELYGTTTDALLDLSPSPSVRTPEGLMARLETVTSDLDGYLEQRARELAKSFIQAVEEVAAEQVRQAEFERQRANDLLEETRLQWKSDLKRVHRAEHRLGMSHPAGACGSCDENRLAEKAKAAVPQEGGRS